MKNGPRRHGCLIPTGSALIQSPLLQKVVLALPAVGALKFFRPALLEQVLQAGLFAAKGLLKLQKDISSYMTHLHIFTFSLPYGGDFSDQAG